MLKTFLLGEKFAVLYLMCTAVSMIWVVHFAIPKLKYFLPRYEFGTPQSVWEERLYLRIFFLVRGKFLVLFVVAKKLEKINVKDPKCLCSKCKILKI